MSKYDDTPCKLIIYPAIVFMFIGIFAGTFLAFNAFLLPDYFSGEYIHFGRVRPLHVHHVLLLWLLSANIGLMYYFVPRLCGRALWSIPLAKVQIALWWLGMFIGVYSFPFGTNYGWEYAELPVWVGYLPIKAIVTVSWLLFSVNIFMTIANRVYDKMYVSLWYTMGTCIWTTFNFCVGNFALEYMPGGISRVNAEFFYVHNLVGLTFTPMGVAAAYYFIPKFTNLPIYSHRLSMIGFWTISFVYAWIGAHHMIHGPISQWLQTTSIIFSIWLFIPVWTVVTNFFVTLKDHWSHYTQSAPIRFLMMGNVFYLLVCIQGPLQALRNVNEITSKTDWIIGHAHMALLGTFTYFAIAGVYFVVPAVVRKPLWSKSLADWHFTLTILGSMLMFMSLFVGGFLQGLQWASWATGTSYAEFHRNLSDLPFLQTVADMWYWWFARGIGGLLLLAGAIIFLVNMFNTIVLKPAQVLPEVKLQKAEGQA